MEFGKGCALLFLAKVLASQNTTESRDPDTNSAIEMTPEARKRLLLKNSFHVMRLILKKNSPLSGWYRPYRAMS